MGLNLQKTITYKRPVGHPMHAVKLALPTRYSPALHRREAKQFVIQVEQSY